MSILTIIQHLLSKYIKIDKIGLEEDALKMMGPYDPVEPLALLIKQLEKRR